ncbi:hypothetical protein H4R21_001138 [Coemansia helicoidea]|uniref:Uncharacterized protein n=1 Tax=Coemansia helicoidea TaxID=1286919 RepID=A0ACC1LDG5_9FUNG|nr:hypothetical protein H4R21_001138 [Coemansia helicoidea]
MSDNAAVLTRGAQVYARKRKARQEQVAEVQFDSKDRRTFLTGFHKRKVQRREHAQAQAQEQAREERLKLRREQRVQKKEELAQRLFGPTQAESSGGEFSDGSDGGEDSGAEDAEVEVLQGDTSVTTVTVTRDFDPAAIGSTGISLDKKLSPQDIAARLERNLTKCLEDDGESDGGAAAPAAKANAKSNKKAPQKQFRYETKAARAAANDKIKSAKLARNKAWAEKRKAAGQGKSGKPGKQGKGRK